MAPYKKDPGILSPHTRNQETIDSFSPLLSTKLYRPPVSPDLEQRTRLVERLERKQQRPLTLISAPAGYGKTVLVSQWLASSQVAHAWFSLDETDNDLGVFVSYLLAAISQTFPDLALRSLNLLAVPNLPPMSVLAKMLINDIDQLEQPFILVLDDIQYIHRQEICELLDLLLQHPPHNLHLVMIGRHDPPLQISSLRARGLMSEFRTLDLRFTPDETARLMQKMLDREIDPAVAADWTRATEGWVTGLRLAVLSLRHRGRDGDLNLHVRGDSRYLRDYLFAEVLGHLPTSYQNCMLKIAFLDRFCGPLCEAICHADGHPTSSRFEGETFIDWLECENLFLIPLDDQHQWFRFHHLFQELLQDMLKTQSSAEEIANLQMRASNWYAENGLVDEALQYALAARDIETAVQLIEQHRYMLMNTEQWNRLDRWLKWLPEEVVVQRAALLSARAFVGLLRGEDLAMVNSSQQAERLLAHLPLHAPEDQIVRAEITVVQAVLDNMTGQSTKSMTKAHSSLLALPATALFIRLIARAALVLGLQMHGDFQQGMALVRKVLSDPARPVNMRARFMQFPSIACYQEGDLIGVLEWSQQALRIAEEFDLVEVISFARKFMGAAHYLRNEFAQAEPCLLALLEDRDISTPSYLAMGVITLALIYQAQDRLVEVEQVINLVIPKFQEKRTAFALTAMEAFRVELAVRRGDLTDAQRLSRSVDFDARPPTWFFYVPQLTAIKLLLAEGTGKSLAEARARLEILDEDMRKVNRNNVRIDALALLARVQAAQEDLPAAIRSLEAALLLGESGGFIRTFVDLGEPMVDLLEQVKAQNKPAPQAAYIDRILAAFPKAQLDRISTTQTPSAEMLTNREFEVLSLLAQRLSNKEIAQQLVISLPTVKSHTLKIYNKLGVKNRKQAVTKAVELGILSKGRTISLPH